MVLLNKIKKYFTKKYVYLKGENVQLRGNLNNKSKTQKAKLCGTSHPHLREAGLQQPAVSAS